MNTKSLKAYAPKARSQFIKAIKKRAALFGIYEGENGAARITFKFLGVFIITHNISHHTSFSK